MRVRSEANRLEQFSDDIAHEIKNTLFSIQSSFDLALHTEHQELGIRKAKKQIMELSGIVDSLLFFARNEEKTLIETNIKELILSHLDTTDHRIQFSDVSDSIKIPVFPELFSIAIGNIISNAQKFTQKDGIISILLKNNGIEIHDSGIGISEKDLPHIFDRLFKAEKTRSSGSGY